MKKCGRKRVSYLDHQSENNTVLITLYVLKIRAQPTNKADIAQW